MIQKVCATVHLIVKTYTFHNSIPFTVMRRAITTATFIFFLFGCGYRFGGTPRELPGGYKTIAIPMFKNLSGDIGAEVYFTNAIIREFNRSKAAHLVDKSEAAVILVGTINKIDFTASDFKDSNSDDGKALGLPENTVLASENSIKVSINIKLIRASDKEKLWESSFSGSEKYLASKLGDAVVNSANPLYDLSVRNEKIEKIALEQMSQAHDRLTERF